ncbi:MAG: 3-oxoacyl-[acyl-carrier-protein] reductase [Gammaproteobacteria bacterium]|jgi:meso-butanediol dehydrogenase/(S,S)-butanediol dehydrogenase/diacetyl reductase|nr:3-oxoacyl-[acyl-carrier-protein] reductase [Gammaproteobacteria bacterium]
MEFDLRDKTILITGAGRGIGRALAIGAAACGATVGALDVDPSLLQELMSQPSGESGRIVPLIADVTDRSAVMAAAAKLAGGSGRLDAVVNNAAVIYYQPINEVTEATLDRMLAVGIKGAVWGVQALIAHMDPSRGAVLINMSSPVAERGFRGTGVYAMTKAAMGSLTRTMAAELGPKGIRANALAPGSVPTPGAIAMTTPEEYQRRAATIPLRRLGQEQDCTNALLFLLSDASSFVNGAILHVDGGSVAAG